MKNKYFNKTSLYLIIFLLGISQLATYGQQAHRMHRINTQKVAFFTESLDLSTEEAESFWPVYNDYNNRKQEINDNRRSLSLFMSSNIENMTEKEISESLEEYVSYEKESYELFTKYNSKFLKILPSSKVMRLYITENQFKAYLLRQVRDQYKGRGRTDGRN